MHPRLNQARGDDAGRTADRAGRVHPQHRLADRAESVRQVELWHHHAFEQVRRFADNDGVDLGDANARIRKGAVGRLTAQPGDRYVEPLAAVVRLAGPEYRRPVLHAILPSASMTHTRFCWSAGPLVAWPSATSARPDMISVAAMPILASPAANIGLPASAPPDGLILTSLLSSSAWRRMISWWVNGACSSATCARAAPAARPALAADGERVRSRAPTSAESILCSNPVIQAGRSASARARSPAARMTTAAPSVTGAQSWARSGSAT